MSGFITQLKLVYHRLNWFRINYGRIKKNSKLLPDHFHGAITYSADGLMSSQNCDFIKDPRFAIAYKAAAATDPWPEFTLEWRVYIVCWLANHVKNLPGDFVECGVNTGAYAKAVILYTDFNLLNKTFFLLDTFEGMVEEQVTEAEKKQGLDKYINRYRNVYDEVTETFKNDAVNIIKGKVPDTLPLCTTDAIAFLSIDMNCVEPEIAAAHYFYNKVVAGGVIILDDYGFTKHINQKHAFDAFAVEKNIQILSLPTGQGIIIKK